MADNQAAELAALRADMAALRAELAALRSDLTSVIRGLGWEPRPGGRADR